jgi:thymidylate synthase (FAD)
MSYLRPISVAEPRLYVVSRPSFDEKAFLSFLETEAEIWNRTPASTEPEEIVEAAGRICYMSFGERQSPKDTAAYIRNLIRLEHESVLEHAVWSFVLAGVSRAFTHQLVRHRIGFAFSQLSQQYRDHTDARVVEPRLVGLSPPVEAIWRRSLEQSLAAYSEIMSIIDSDEMNQLLPEERREQLRAIRSAARSVLPEATEAVIFFTANARAIRYFLDTRGEILGDEEMRRVSALLLTAVRTEAPSLFQDFELVDAPDGLPLVRHVGLNDS